MVCSIFLAECVNPDTVPTCVLEHSKNHNFCKSVAFVAQYTFISVCFVSRDFLAFPFFEDRASFGNVNNPTRRKFYVFLHCWLELTWIFHLGSHQTTFANSHQALSDGFGPTASQRRRRDIFVETHRHNLPSSVGAAYSAPTGLEILLIRDSPKAPGGWRTPRRFAISAGAGDFRGMATFRLARQRLGLRRPSAAFSRRTITVAMFS